MASFFPETSFHLYYTHKLETGVKSIKITLQKLMLDDKEEV